MTGSIRQYVPFTEETFHASHLIQRWQREFPGETDRILMRAEPPGEPPQTVRGGATSPDRERLTAVEITGMPVERRQKMTQSEAPEPIYQVVMNHEEQYSIWPAHRALPAGWQAAGPAAAKQECLDYIAGVWTDMRPLSLRRRMADAGAADRPE